MARKASRKMPKRGPSTAARKPAARNPAGKKPARKPAARKPGTGSRQPMSGYGAKPRNPMKADRDGATNFSPEPNRTGRDASVTPAFTGRFSDGSTRRSVLRSITTSEHFEYGKAGDPGAGRPADRAVARQQAAQSRRVRDARNRGAYLAGRNRRTYR